MALNQQRLEDKINNIIDQCRLDQGDGQSAKTKFSQLLAKAIVEEIKELEIDYSSGLIAPNGVVTGKINATIK